MKDTETPTQKAKAWRIVGWCLVAFLVPFATWNAAQAGFEVSRAREAMSWPSYPADIVSAAVVKKRARRSSYHRIEVRYAYRVGGTSFEASRFAYCFRNRVDFSPSPLERALAAAVERGVAFVNPLDATEAVIERDHDFEGEFDRRIFWSVFQAAGAIVGLFVCRWVAR